MQKITTHLWFDKEAKEAADFYVSVLGKDSKIINVVTIHNTPSGDCDIVNFELLGQKFMAISAGPIFKFNPSISFFVGCDTKGKVDILWNKLSEGGKVLMKLDKYPFSEWYGWVQDKYGLTWQIMYTGDNKTSQSIIPVLMYTGVVAGKAEEAMNFYASIFHNSKINFMMRYAKDQEPDREGTIAHAGFILEDQQFAAMDSARPHDFNFNEAISFIVNCKNQQEVDYYWEKLSAVPKSEQCGWLKDKYGVSWQIVPVAMEEMMNKGTKEQVDRVTQAFLRMKKFDIETLKQAYKGK